MIELDVCQPLDDTDIKKYLHTSHIFIMKMKKLNCANKDCARDLFEYHHYIVKYHKNFLLRSLYYIHKKEIIILPRIFYVSGIHAIMESR